MTGKMYEIMEGLWSVIQPWAGPFLGVVGIHEPYELLAAIIIISLVSLFLIQIIAWMTPPNPAYGGPIAGGIVAGILAYMFIEWKVTLIPTVLGACITGVYGWQGYVYLGGLVVLIGVFLANIGDGWKRNRPLEMMK